jgi:hypothetical protein
MGTLVDVNDLRQVLDIPRTVADDASLEAVIAATESALLPHLTGDDLSTHAAHPNCSEAALGMSVQVWQSRSAPGGQMIGVDLMPQSTPHLLGPGLLMRFQGLLGPCLPYGGAVVG